MYCPWVLFVKNIVFQTINAFDSKLQIQTDHTDDNPSKQILNSVLWYFFSFCLLRFYMFSLKEAVIQCQGTSLDICLPATILFLSSILLLEPLCITYMYMRNFSLLVTKKSKTLNNAFPDALCLSSDKIIHLCPITRKGALWQLRKVSNLGSPRSLTSVKAPPRWLSGEHVGLMTWWL